jgi:hypothetical protein
MPASGKVVMAGNPTPGTRTAAPMWSGPVARWAIRLAGPVLIVLGPAIVLHDFWLGSRLSTQQVDLLPFWLPRWCFLGRALAAGHIPTWLPSQFGGVPFASDPQSGWLYLPAMLLFGTLSCSRALGAVILLNPILAGLGLHLFLRHEGLGRPAATVGGVTLALSMCGSVVVLSMPFAGTIAWTAVALAGASGYVMADRLPRRIAWLGVTGFALMQVAGAHLTNGLLMAGVLVILYLIARGLVEVRAERRRAWGSIWTGVVLLAAFPVLAAAALLPRLALLPRTTIGQGYGELSRVTAQLSGAPLRSPFVTRGLSVWWGTAFARAPGGYVGVVAVVLLAVALASKRWRLPAAAFGVAGLLGWFLNLDVVIRQSWVRRAATGSGLGELWLRDPSRFRYLVVVAFAALAGYGAQAWFDLPAIRDRDGLWRRAAWLLAPLAVFVAAPLLAGSPFAPYLPLAIGVAAGLPVLLMAARGSALFRIALPAVAAVELVVVGLAGLSGPAGRVAAAPTTRMEPFDHSFPKLHRPDLPARAFLIPGPIGRPLVADRWGFGRYVTFDPDRVTLQVAQARPPSIFVEPAKYEDGQSILLGLDEIQGYSPVQLLRYWRLVRRVDRVPLFYSAGTFQSLPPQVLKLFAVRWVITTKSSVAGWTPVAREGQVVLYRVPDSEERASIVHAWQQHTVDQGLTAVLAAGFDPDQTAIVEDQPRLAGVDLEQRPTSPKGVATYDETGPGHVLIRTTTNFPGLAVIRNAFDKGWHAKLDGHDAQLLVADYMMQAVAVPGGRHVVELKYRDPWIGSGLLVSGVAWGLLLGLFGWALVRDRRVSAEGSPMLTLRR